MDDIKGFVKQYWPYIVGGIVGIYILLRYSGGGSSGGGNTDYAAFMQANAQASQQNAQLQAQQAALAAQQAQAAGELQLNRDALNAQILKDKATLDLQKSAVYTEGFNTFQTSQAAMATAIGTSSAAVITALNQPSITAMQAAAIENAAALEAAGNVAAGSYQAQAAMQAANAATVAGVGQRQGVSIISQPESQAGGIVGSIANAVSSYFTGGLSGLGGGGGGQQQQGYGGGNWNSPSANLYKNTTGNFTNGGSAYYH